MKPSVDLSRVLLVVTACAVVTWGWLTFQFTLDDAYIAFRYVANLVDGRGLVWNPPPFAPVEGYSSFSWVVLLAAIWKFTGIEPPLASNVVSLLCTWAQVLLVFGWLDRRKTPRLLTAVALLGVVTNRNVLTWSTSGLETALVDLLVLGWALALWDGARRVWLVSAVAALLALARPDGLLFVAATLPLLVWECAIRRRDARSLLGLLPLLLVPAHLLWRHNTYGLWLPNTYYAKVATAWPEAGARYFASFVFENGLYVWPALLVWLRPPLNHRLVRVGVVATVAAYLGYYLVKVGGDHFEYRVLTWTVPLFWIAGARLATHGRAPFAVLVATLVLSLPLPWLHWSITKDLSGYTRTNDLAEPLAPHVPAALRPLVDAWDGNQRWLIEHKVGVRHQEHKVFSELFQASLPPRAEGASLTWDKRPIFMSECVGAYGWALPNAAIIDTLGLTDRVIARGPTRADLGIERRMAHERTAPDGYLACWRPNVVPALGERTLEDKTTIVYRPSVPMMTDDEIRACDEGFYARVTSGVR